MHEISDLLETPTNENAKPKHDPRKFEKFAERFIDDLSERANYPLSHSGRFYVYDGTRYVEERDLDNSIRTFFRKNKIPQSNNVIGNVKPIVANFANRSAREYGAMPFYFGDDPNFPKPKNIIAYRNGLLDIERYLAGDLQLIPHSPQWASTICLPYDFDPTAVCPTWLAFLDQVFEGDADRIALQQEWCGYLLAQDTSFQKLMVMTGKPRAGKGTTQRIQQALVGAENSTGFGLQSLAERFGPRQLVGKLAAFVGEVNLDANRDKYRIFETLNSIVGGDAVSVEEKHKVETESLVLPTRFVIACNEMPNFNDRSGALAARLLILDFNVSFEGREDRQLDGKLLAEISGISAWALEGYARLKRNGRFTETAEMKELLNQFRRESSEVLGFVQDCLVVESKLNPGNLVGVTFSDEPQSISKAEIDEAYRLWAGQNYKSESDYNRAMSWFFRNLRAIVKGKELRYDKKAKRYDGIGSLAKYNALKGCGESTALSPAAIAAKLPDSVPIGFQPPRIDEELLGELRNA